MANMNLNFDDIDLNIKLKSIEVDPRLRVRDSTGLAFLDVVLSGDTTDTPGFVPGTAYLYTGTPGAGKTTLALQLADSLSRKGHHVLYNTGEESLAQVKMCAERLKLRGDFTVGSSVFVDRPTGKAGDRVKVTLRERIMDLVAKAEKSNKRVKDINAQRRVYVIVDSLQAMNDGKYGFASNSKTPVRVLEELTKICKEHFVTMIVIGQVSKTGDFSGAMTLLHMVDGHLHIYVDDSPKSDTFGMRLLECRKNRFGPTGITVPLDIKKTGLYAPTTLTRGMRV